MDDSDTRDPAGTGEGSSDRLAWRHLELAYDTADRTRVRIDGRELEGGPEGEPEVTAVVARLGQEGWEMVGSAPRAGTEQVLWFKRPAEGTSVGDRPAGADGQTAALHTVTLVSAGNSWFDPAARARLTTVLQGITGHSGWRVGRMVDKAPRVVAEGVTQPEAERIRQVLEDLGATVEVG